MSEEKCQSGLAKIDASKFLEFLDVCGNEPFIDPGHCEMAVCPGCGDIVYPGGGRCDGDARETPLCDRVPQPMTFRHVLELLTAALAERDELSQRNRGLENSVALAVTANDSLVADNAKLTKERDATEARVRELEISKDWPRTDAEIDRVLIGHDQLKAMRDHFKKCQLATWADQQKLLKLADNSLLFRSHHQKSAAVCELCLEIYTDIIDRIDAIFDPSLTQQESDRDV